MPAYDYKCQRTGCGYRFTLHCSVNDPDKAEYDARKIHCPDCTAAGFAPPPRLRRVFGFQMPRVWHAHFSDTTGTIVSSPADFKRQLREISERQTEKTGIPHDIQPADPAVCAPSSEEGLRSQHDTAVALGMKEPTGRTVL